MKFKIAVVSLLTAITIICGWTGYRLVQEAEKQTFYQEITAISTELSTLNVDYTMQYEDKDGNQVLTPTAKYFIAIEKELNRIQKEYIESR